jgi:CHAT domain-containing protein/tetratricopeptide (TPR) repeat protein
MLRLHLVFAWAAIAAAAAIGRTPPSQQAKPIKLELGKKLHKALVKEDPVKPGMGRYSVFSFTAPEAGNYTVSAGAQAFDAMVILREENGTDLQGFDWNGDLGPGDSDAVGVTMQKGETGLALVVSTFGEVGEFDVSFDDGSPPPPETTEAFAKDLDFFKEAFKFASARSAPARAARAALKAVGPALALGRASDAEEMAAKAAEMLEKAPEAELQADERDFTRVRLGHLKGVIAEFRCDWSAALASFVEAEKRCNVARQAPKTRPDAKWRDGYTATLMAALAGQYEVSYGQGDAATALPPARKLREIELSEGARPPDFEPTVIQCALLELLDRNGLFDEATRLAPDCTARIAKCGHPSRQVEVLYSRYLLGRAHYSEAIDRMRAALGRAEESDDALSVITLAGELSAAYLELGNYSDSHAMAQRMLEAATAVGNEVAKGQALTGLSESERKQGYLPQAREHAEKAVQLLRGEKAPGQSAQALMSLVKIDAEEKRYDDARKRVAELQQLPAAPDPAARPDRIAIEARNVIAGALKQEALDSGSTKFDDAVAIYERALADAEAIHDRRDAAIAREQLGDIARRKGDFKLACELSRRAADELREIGCFEEMHKPLLTIAESALSSKDLSRARAVLKEGVESVESPTLAGMVGSSAALLRVNLWEWGEVEQELVTSDVEQGPVTLAASAAPAGNPDATALLQQGATAAWRWKTRALLAGISDHARRREAKSDRARNDLQEQVARLDHDSKALKDAYLNSLAERDIDPLRKRMQEDAARAKELRVDDDVPDYATLRKAVVGPDLLLVEFVNGLHDLYAYAIDAASIRRFKLGPREEIESLAAAYIDLVSDATRLPPPAAVASSGRELYRRLLEPIVDGAPARLTRLLIAPTPELGAVPFDALVVSVAETKGGPPRFKDLRYVLDRWINSIVPSGAVAFELTRQRPRGREGKWLLVGAPRAPKSKKGGDASSLEPATPQMREEVAAIAKQVTKDRDALAQIERVKHDQTGIVAGSTYLLLLGEEANKERVHGDLSDYAVLHFACHGDFARREPRDAALLLAPNGADSGRLGVRDVLELELDANLTILSACSTARGRGFSSDGEQSLARAFLVAGSRAVIATLWPVVDKPTSEIMGDFHKSVGTAAASSAPDADFAARLRDAKLQVRRRATSDKSKAASTDDAAPTLWAGFVYYGIGPRK